MSLLKEFQVRRIIKLIEYLGSEHEKFLSTYLCLYLLTRSLAEAPSGKNKMSKYWPEEEQGETK